jgi:hypothetical protein
VIARIRKCLLVCAACALTAGVVHGEPEPSALVDQQHCMFAIRAMRRFSLRRSSRSPSTIATCQTRRRCSSTSCGSAARRTGAIRRCRRRPSAAGRYRRRTRTRSCNGYLANKDSMRTHRARYRPAKAAAMRISRVISGSSCPNGARCMWIAAMRSCARRIARCRSACSRGSI